MSNEWAIMDLVGILFRGTEEDMKARWSDPDKICMEESISGDLLLIEIHGIVK